MACTRAISLSSQPLSMHSEMNWLYTSWYWARASSSLKIQEIRGRDSVVPLLTGESMGEFTVEVALPEAEKPPKPKL